MKHYKSIEEKVDHVLTNVICDLATFQYDLMRGKLILEDLKINELILKAKSLLIPTEKRAQGRGYWLARGWPLSVAQAKIADARKEKTPKMSPFGVDFWLQRINPDTYVNFTKVEAEYKRNSLRPIRPEYWIDRGYSQDEASTLAKQTKDKNNHAGAKSVKDRNKEEVKSFSPRCQEYWLSRGYSESDADIAVKNFQTTFSKSICADKFGEKDGLYIWQSRQDRWLNTLNSKSPEEIADITRRKITHLNGCVSGGEISLKEGIEKEIKIISQIIIHASPSKRYIFDMGANNKLIEYNGTYWHADPRHYKANDVIGHKKLSAAEIWEKDRLKLETAKSQGYEVLVIWEADFKENKQREIDKCINFLTQ